MNNASSVMTLRLPFDLKHKVELMAEKQRVSINQLAMYAFSKEISELETAERLASRWRGKGKRSVFNAFDAAMAKVRKKSPPSWDRLPRFTALLDRSAAHAREIPLEEAEKRFSAKRR